MRIIKTKEDLLNYFEYAGYTSSNLASRIDSLICTYAEAGHRDYKENTQEALYGVWDGEVKGNALEDVMFEISDELGIKIMDDYSQSEYGQSSGISIQR
jgi:hypothetical protein